MLHTTTALEKLKIGSEFNLLILGQSGTGKSAWINSMANYLTYPTLDDALKANNPICLIPSSFSLADSNYHEVPITIGEADENERAGTALSSTRSPRVYTFKKHGQKINIIDVPGIGDTEGLEIDKKNIQEILDTVALFKKLHCICIVLKAGDSILTMDYQYCLSELLSHLHKNALKNIAFVFTNTRGADYTPGNARRVLNAYLAKLGQEKGIHVELNHDNMYCIDNESFRYQCAYYQHRQFRDMNIEPYIRSWDISKNETFRLIKHMRKVDPHNAAETLSINEARAIIITLVPTLTTISALIQTNVAHYEDNRDEIIKQLRLNLAVSEFDIKSDPLSQPRTVCTENKCIGVEKIAGTTKYSTFYKQICHETCFLQDIRLMRYPEPGLVKCWAMDNAYCHQCGCHYTKHMHIDFNQLRVLKKAPINEELQKLSRKDARYKIDQTIQKLQAEQNVIIKIMIKFGGFLHENSILRYNEDIGNRLQMEIRKEETLSKLSKKSTALNHLKTLFDTYTRMHKNLQSVIDASNGINEIPPEQIIIYRDELFRLPLYGQKFQELYNQGRELRAHNYANKHFVPMTANYMP